MRVLLASTYELGHQPLHVASPAARLLAEGHEVRCVDLAVEPWPDDQLNWAEGVAFSVPMHTAMRLAVLSARRIRDAHSELPIAFYGLYAAVGADRSVAELADQRIVGEYEDELARWCLDGNGTTRIKVDLGRKQFAPPARHLLPPLNRYAKLRYLGEERLAGYVEASHGCRHRCRHCPIPAVYDGRFRVTGLDTVLADIGQLVGMGARHISFGDPDFLNAPRYALDVLTASNRSYPDLTFDLTVKVEHLLEHADLLDTIAGCNVVFLVSAFETTNDHVLGLLDKGHTASDMSNAARLVRAHGLGLRPSWLPFTPWTRSGDLAEIFAFLRDHDLLKTVDPVQLSIRLLVPDGSLLLDLPDMGAYLKEYDPEGLTYRWRAADPAVDLLQRKLAKLAEDGASGASVLQAMWDLVMGAESMPVWVDGDGPGLTESWFCCAEPTGRQLSAVGDRRSA